MKNILKMLLVVLLLSTMVSCDAKEEEVDEKVSNEVTQTQEKEEEEVLRVDLGFINQTKVTLIKGQEAGEILAADDDYTTQLSAFDYASKFKSNSPLNYEQRLEKYLPSVKGWTSTQEATLKETVEEVNRLLAGRTLNLPDEITIIFENGKIEGGAAYTRGSSIIFPTNRVNGFNTGLTELFIHELFHVYSRNNKDKREAMYGIIGYKKCDALVMPDEIKELTIANPDAPDNNYYLTCTYNEDEIAFIPIIYSKEAYDIDSNESFFKYLNDDMLAVEITGTTASALRKDEALVIVKKHELDNFYEQIGNNTSYTYHPEETIADNFVFLVMNSDVTDPWVLEGLSNIIFE